MSNGAVKHAEKPKTLAERWTNAVNEFLNFKKTDAEFKDAARKSKLVYDLLLPLFDDACKKGNATIANNASLRLLDIYNANSSGIEDLHDKMIEKINSYSETVKSEDISRMLEAQKTQWEGTKKFVAEPGKVFRVSAAPRPTLLSVGPTPEELLIPATIPGLGTNLYSYYGGWGDATTPEQQDALKRNMNGIIEDIFLSVNQYEGAKKKGYTNIEEDATRDYLNAVEKFIASIDWGVVITRSQLKPGYDVDKVQRALMSGPGGWETALNMFKDTSPFYHDLLKMLTPGNREYKIRDYTYEDTFDFRIYSKGAYDAYMNYLKEGVPLPKGIQFFYVEFHVGNKITNCYITDDVGALVAAEHYKQPMAEVRSAWLMPQGIVEAAARAEFKEKTGISISKAALKYEPHLFDVIPAIYPPTAEVGIEEKKPYFQTTVTFKRPFRMVTLGVKLEEGKEPMYIADLSFNLVEAGKWVTGGRLVAEGLKGFYAQIEGRYGKDYPPELIVGTTIDFNKKGITLPEKTCNIFGRRLSIGGQDFTIERISLYAKIPEEGIKKIREGEIAEGAKESRIGVRAEFAFGKKPKELRILGESLSYINEKVKEEGYRPRVKSMLEKAVEKEKLGTTDEQKDFVNKLTKEHTEFIIKRQVYKETLTYTDEKAKELGKSVGEGGNKLIKSEMLKMENWDGKKLWELENQKTFVDELFKTRGEGIFEKAEKKK
jgi:hypothetical protein